MIEMALRGTMRSMFDIMEMLRMPIMDGGEDEPRVKATSGDAGCSRD
jgi:hypothetical protein